MMVPTEDRPPEHSEGSDTKPAAVAEGVRDSERGFGDQPARSAKNTREQLIREISYVLATLAHDSDVAKTIVKRAGFPVQRLPDFKIPIDFWVEIVGQAADGAITLETLIDEALVRFPHNQKLRDLKEAIIRAGPISDVGPVSSAWHSITRHRAILRVASSFAAFVAIAAIVLTALKYRSDTRPHAEKTVPATANSREATPGPPLPGAPEPLHSISAEEGAAPKRDDPTVTRDSRATFEIVDVAARTTDDEHLILDVVVANKTDDELLLRGIEFVPLSPPIVTAEPPKSLSQ